MGNHPTEDRQNEDKEVLDPEQEMDQMEQALEDAQDLELSDDEVLDDDQGHSQRMLELREQHRLLTEERDRKMKAWAKLKEFLGELFQNEDPAEREHPLKGKNPEIDAFIEASRPGFLELVKECKEERRVRLAKEAKDGQQGSSSDVK